MDIARNVISVLKLNDPQFVPFTQKGFHPTRTVKIVIDDTEVGFVGQKLGEGNLFGVELNLDELFSCKAKTVLYEPVSNFPYLSFDLAFVVNENVTVDNLQNVILKNCDDLIEDIKCFDVFKGQALEEGKKSIAFALRVRSKDATLGDEDQQNLRTKIISAVENQLGGKLR